MKVEKENSIITEVTEPKIETRFGFEKPRGPQSNAIIKIFIFFTVLSLGAILWMRSPDKTLDAGSGVKAPESSEVSSSQNQFALDNYSAEKERNSMTEKNKRKVSHVVVKLPGIQKIDRIKSGQIPPGSEVRAKLLSGASNGLVKVEVLDSLKVRGETFITAGDILIGQGQSTEERLYIRFSQVVHRNGTFEPILAQAVDNEDKIIGIKASKFVRYAYKYGAAVGLNFVGGMTESLQDRTVVGEQVVTTPNARNALLSGANKAAIEMANEQMTDLRNHPPPITIEAGQEIIVVFEGG